MAGESTEQLGLFEQIRGFNAVYWIANVMEMFERLAYYGLRTVLPVYMVLSVEAGGPEFDHIQKGQIYALWALVQSGLPVFTGGYADRYGYKLTVAVAIAVKMVGYLVMAYAVEMALVTSAGASAGVPGHDHVYYIFLLGSLGLAGGTAIFKPGLQGIIGLQLTERNASVGWSVFYQIVNVGGFLGPFLAGWMRLLAWKYVFISCALIVALNYIFLFTFPEPEKGESEDLEDPSGPPARGAPELVTGVLLFFAGLSGQFTFDGFETSTPLTVFGALLVIAGVYRAGNGGGGRLGAMAKVLWNSTVGICEPRLMAFLVIFSGFWAMFHQLFDLLPNYIHDWVDSSGVANAIAAPILGLFGAELPADWGGNLPQEYMINLNAGMCMTFAFLVGYLTGKVRSMTAMIGGIFVASAAIWGLGVSMNGWIVLFAIGCFSLGELMASPTKMRYFSSIAPPGKKGLYLGYINATGGIGWFLGSLIAGEMYERDGDKVVLARRYLVDELGRAEAAVEAMPKDDVVPTLASALNSTPDGVRVLLMETYDPSFIWTHFALIGIVSMVGLILFDLVTRAKTAAEPWILTGLTAVVAFYTYGWEPAGFFVVLMVLYIVLERTAPHLLPQGQTE
jgi:dipeptide/tripeptide permease